MIFRRIIFPSDRWMGETCVVVRRIGRDEWLDGQANLTDDPERAMRFSDAMAAMLFARTYTDEPKLWTWETVPALTVVL